MTGIALSPGTTTAPVTTGISEPTTPISTTIEPVTQTTTQPASTGPVTAPTTVGDDVWMSALSEENKAYAKTKGWTTHDAQIKSQRDLEAAFSQKTAATSAPASVAEYKFDVPADLAKEVGYDNKFADAFKTWAHKSGLSVEAAKNIHDSFVDYAKTSAGSAGAAHSEALGQTITKATSELHKAWGPADTPTFNRSLEMAQRTIRMSDPGLRDALREHGVIVDVGGKDTIANSTIMRVLADLGGKLYAEDSLYGSATRTDVNPFDDKTTDMAAQSHLITKDPARAELLIRAAGKDAMFAQFLAKRKG